MEDDGGEACEDGAGCEGVRGAEEVGIYIGVEEGRDGEDDAEDGDGGRDGQGKVVGVVVDDTVGISFQV